MNEPGQDTDLTRESGRAHAHRPPPGIGPGAPGSSVVSAVASDTHRRDTQWRRLDRRMLLIQPIEALKQFLPLIVIVLFAGSSRNQGPWWSNLLIVLVPIVIGVWSWATTSYRISDEQLVLRRGVVQRTTLTARLDRVRSVDVTASLLQRLLGVASVKIGTGSEKPFSLDGLAAPDAAALRTELLHAARDREPPAGVPAAARTHHEDTTEEVIGVFSPAWTRYAPFSLTGLLTILAAVGFAAQFADDLGDRVLESEAGHAVVEYVLGLTTIALVVQGAALAVAVLVGAAVITYVLRYWGYRLTRHPRGTLGVVRGLLTTRSTTIEERRLRGVTVTRPLLLRLVGAARADALVTGLTDDAASTTTSSDLLVPPAPRAEVVRIAATVLRDEVPLRAALRRHGAAARRRRHVRALTSATITSAVVIAVVLWLDASLWYLTVPATLILTAPVLAEARYRRLGHAVTAGHLVSRAGLFPEETTVIPTGAVIGWNLTETLFQRRVGLVSLVATIAAGDDRVEIPDLRVADAEAIIRAVTPGLGEPFMIRRGIHGDSPGR